MRNTKTYNAILLLLLGSLFLWVLISVHKDSALIFFGTKTEGVVIDTNFEVTGGAVRLYGRTPVTRFSYTDQRGEIHTLIETGKTNLFWDNGQSVNIYYDQNDPSRATTFTLRKMLSFLALFSFCAIFFIAIIFVVRRKQQI